jgi:hypothetical protein
VSFFLLAGAGTLYYFKYRNAQECNEDDFKDVKEYKKAKNKQAYQKIDQMYTNHYQNSMINYQLS